MLGARLGLSNQLKAFALSYWHGYKYAIQRFPVYSYDSNGRKSKTPPIVVQLWRNRHPALGACCVRACKCWLW